jgi:O-acetyl-ADP-ribose deacetylase (regulator of RNase III)
MDAGMDLAVLKFFGPALQERIQQNILQDHLGEQSVGTAFLVPTGHAKHPWVVHAPTMRGPMNIVGTDNVYLATWATLLAVRQHNQTATSPIATLVCPAFGTGNGGVMALEAGVQMRLAWEHYLSPPKHINPSMAQLRQERIHYGDRWGFEYPRKIE